MRFLLLFLITNSLVVGAGAAVTAGATAIAAPLVVLALAGLAVTIRVVVLARPARPAQPSVTRRDLQRLVNARDRGEGR